MALCWGQVFNQFALLEASVVTPVFTQRFYPQTDLSPQYVLTLTAEERRHNRMHVASECGTAVRVHLQRGHALRDGDWLRSEQGEIAQIRAKPEPVLTVKSMFPLALLQAAYQLGHHQIPLEITAGFLRLAPNSKIQAMLIQRGLQVVEEVAPFQPEANFSTGDSPLLH